MTASPRVNVELKAVDRDPARTLAACLALDDAEDHGTLWQRDTYFVVPHGRLKLREQRPGGAWLIPYERADEAAARESRYRLIGVDDANACREGLSAALGVRVTVEKERRLFLWRGVRIHLDRVVGLGSFVELEGVVGPASALDEARERVAWLRGALGIAGEDVVAWGYADAISGKEGGT